MNNPENPQARRARLLARATAAEINAKLAETNAFKAAWLQVAAIWHALAATRRGT